MLEHGVPLPQFWAEADRIVSPGGFVILSTDFWCAPLEFGDLGAYGHPIHVFQPSDIREAITVGAANGFRPLAPVDIRCEDKAVHWQRMDLDFTFIFLAFEKSAGQATEACS